MTAPDSRTLADLGWPTLVEGWATRCATTRGAATVRTAPLFATADEARARVAEVAEARHLATVDAALPLGGISDVAAAIGRVRKSAALDAAELVAVARTAQAMTRLRKHLREHEGAAPRLAARGEPLADLGHVYHPILEAFDPDGKLVDHASPALGPLRKAVASLTAQLDRRMEELVNDARYAPLLQDTYYTQRDDRYVLPVRTDGKGFIKGIVHGTSQSGATIFIEPEEIVDLNNKKRLAECEVADEERRIFVRLSGWIAEEADAIDAGLVVLEHMDVVAAAGILAEELVASAPEIDDAPRVALLHARHPLMLLAGRRCVANDVTVRAGGILLVSGPNAGGKTVALKTTGLCALMVRAGLHLPAESGSVMGWFANVRSDIGDGQSLEANLSTFTGHMTALRAFVAEAAPGTLLLLDEIAVGTDPEQGAALAQAVLEAFAERGVTALVTTHYERLKALGAADARFANASVGFDMEKLEPTFKLHLGVPGSSGALVVARRMGLPGDVVERAATILGDGGLSVENLLSSVAEQRRRLEHERAQQLAEIEALESERMALRVDRERAKVRGDKEHSRAHAEALSALRQARVEIDHVRAELRRKAQAEAATIDDVKGARRTLVKPGAAVASNAPAAAMPPGKRASEADLVPGTPVLVPGLGGRGHVAAAPERGKVEVQLGGMHMTVDVSSVLLDSHRAASKAAERKHEPKRDAKAAAATAPAADVQLVDGAGDGRATARTPGTTLDLRGQRVDEALSNIDRWLDEQLLLGHDAVFIVHGHGTGVLRSAVRERLSAHPAAKRARPGEAGEGGDGVTVVLLRD
ncbi:MAG TPA: Smr/MutS family protein [Kofleriaceae bacterium]|nr:Smr/MutS family protein [Kofleriaceae bacterium]